MAGSQSKSKQGSLAALAARLDTRKKPLPADSKGQVEALREVVKDRAAKRAPVHARAVTKPKPSVSKAVTSSTSAPPKAPLARPAATQPVSKPKTPAPRPATTTPAPKPPAHAAEVKPASLPSVSRSVALTSLQRSPSAPVKLATPKPVMAKSDSNTRRYPRATIQVRARLSLADDPSRVFEATLPTVNISVGGMFLESSFFLKLGTKLSVELQLPPKGRSVHVKADVVRVDTNGDGPSGFALRFSEYFDGSEVVLATHFLSPVLKEFITAYAKQHRFDASAEYIAHTADVLAAWELKKAELGGDVWSLTSTK
jgi:hypothetical protein